MNGDSPLRAAREKAIAEHGCSLKDLTVLAPVNDPCLPLLDSEWDFAKQCGVLIDSKGYGGEAS